MINAETLGLSLGPSADVAGAALELVELPVYIRRDPIGTLKPQVERTFFLELRELPMMRRAPRAWMGGWSLRSGLAVFTGCHP